MRSGAGARSLMRRFSLVDDVIFDAK